MKTCGIATAAVLAAGWGYLRHIQLPQGPSRLHWGDACFGHRGCMGKEDIPENTIPAFAYALENGCKGVELDIRLTKDNQLVVFHDAFTAPALKGETRRIDELSLAELRSMNYQIDPTSSVQVPTLEECILFCQENYLKMLIELKELKRPKLCADLLRDLYKRYPKYMYDNTMVIAFSPFALYNVRKFDRNIAVGIIHSGCVLHHLVTVKPDTYPKAIEYATPVWDWLLNMIESRIAPWVIGASMVGPKFTLYNENMRRKWHSRKIAVYLWGYQNPTECTDVMKQEGVIIAADDRYKEYVREVPLGFGNEEDY